MDGFSERVEPSGIRDDFDIWKSKQVTNYDISTQPVNNVMARLGYKKI